MSTHRHFDKICCAVLAVVLLLTAAFVNAEKFGVQPAAAGMDYETKLFDTSSVHTIDIEMDDWEEFLDGCEDEEYEACSVIIDNEAYKNVAIRAKGNTSLSSVAKYGNDRYSFKIEFDHYDSGKNYYGLDKLSLNNIIQDNTYLKDYLSYQMMGGFGVAAPLCSFAYLTVNGEDWGLYLAVESVEESFLERNYGSSYGELYKPDSTDMGGGRGNGVKFDMGGMEELFQKDGSDNAEVEMRPNAEGKTQAMIWNKDEVQNAENTPDDKNQMENRRVQDNGELPENSTMPDFSGRNTADDSVNTADDGGNNEERQMSGSDDVALVYSDDEYSSYSNIFDNAKTNPSDTDKDRLIASLKSLSEGENIEAVVDVEQVIRYFVVHNFVCNFDSYTGSLLHNYYLYEKDGRLSMIPWDYNLAFGGFQSGTDATGTVNYPIDNPVSNGSNESRPMLAWIFADEEYTELYHQYFTEFVGEYFESGAFEEMLDSVIALISPYVEKDPTKFCTYEEFEEGTAALRGFCLLRAKSVKGQAEGTIPSTSDEQKEDSSSLIDASDVSVSAMGSMGNGMENGMRNAMGGHGQEGENSDEQNMNKQDMNKQDMNKQDMNKQDMNKQNMNEQDTNEQGELHDNNFPDRMDAADVSEDNRISLLGVSIAFLLVGLLVAFKYKT